MNALTGTSAAAAASAKPTSLLGRNFNSFVNILAAQIKNQDPLAPMDTHEFTNQLVQFTQVQEMMELSGSFKAISAQMADGNLVSAGQLVGRNITFKSDVVHLAGGHAEIPHTLGAGAAGAAITIKSEGGSVVRTLRETAGPVSEPSRGTGSTIGETRCRTVSTKSRSRRGISPATRCRQRRRPDPPSLRPSGGMRGSSSFQQVSAWSN